MPTAEHQAVLAALRGLVPAWRPERVGNIAYLPGGYANDNYRFEHAGAAYALRVARRPGGPGGRGGLVPRGRGGPVPGGKGGLAPNEETGVDRRHEARFLELPCAPDVVAFDPSTGDLLTRWIPGTLLADAPVPPATAGAYLRALHADIPSGLRRYDPIDVIRRDLDGADEVSPVAALALERLHWTPDAVCGCHNDLNPWNILRTDDGWRTLDWEFAGDNDPLFDVVCLGRGLGYDDAALARLAEARFGPPGVAPRRRLDTCIVFELREHAWAVQQMALGNDREGVRDQAVRSERTLRVLLERQERGA